MSDGRRGPENMLMTLENSVRRTMKMMNEAKKLPIPFSRARNQDHMEIPLDITWNPFSCAKRVSYLKGLRN